jgi:hypothetical protein
VSVAALTSFVKREFIRRIYREASPATEAGRNTYLDTIAETAMGLTMRGKILTGTSDKGTSAQYAMFANWLPSQVIELVDFARDYTSYSTVTLSLSSFAVVPTSGMVNLQNSSTQPLGYLTS